MRHQTLVGPITRNRYRVTVSYSLPLVGPVIFSHGTDTSSVTSFGNSQIGVEEPKPPVSEALSRTVSNWSDSDTVVTDFADDQGALGRTPLLPAPGHFQRVSDDNKHDPTIHDTRSSHVDPTEIPASARGTTHPISHVADPPGGRPLPLRIMTDPPLGSRSSDDTGTTYFTPGASREVRDSRTFDSSATIRVGFSGLNPGSRDAAHTDRSVVGVQPTSGRVRSKRLLSIRPLEPPRRRRSSRRSNTDPSSETTSVEPRHGLRIPLAPPSRNGQGSSYSREPERRRDSTLSFSSSPFDEFRSGAGPSQRIPEAEISTAPIPGRETGFRHPESKPPGRNERNDIGGDREAAFPRSGMKRAVPEWGGIEGMNEGRREEEGKERGDRSYTPILTDNASISSEVEDLPWDLNLTPVSPTRPGVGYTAQDAVSILLQRPDPSFVKLVLTKLGVPKSSQLRSSSLSKRKNLQSSKPEQNKRDVKTVIKNIFGGHKTQGPHG